MNVYQEAINEMEKQFGLDVPMSLATCVDNDVSVRVVDCYYKKGSFYVTSYDLSSKVQQLMKNPKVAICKGLFQCFGIATNLGNPKLKENSEIRKELKKVFYKFYDKHVNEEDPHTCIIKIHLLNAFLFTKNNKYVIDFEKESAKKFDFFNDIEY